jgi:hypothetical protein
MKKVRMDDFPLGASIPTMVSIMPLLNANKYSYQLGANRGGLARLVTPSQLSLWHSIVILNARQGNVKPNTWWNLTKKLITATVITEINKKKSVIKEKSNQFICFKFVRAIVLAFAVA